MDIKTAVISFILGVLSRTLGNYLYSHLVLKFRRSKKDYMPEILKDTNSWLTSGEYAGEL